MSNIPQVVIVGRTNVGKSSLFNRIAKTTQSIIMDEKGVTRDYVKDIVEYKNQTFELIDTGGICAKSDSDSLIEQIKQQALGLLEHAQMIVLVADGTVGLLPEELELAKLLHRLKKQVCVVVNKVDVHATQENIHAFNRLGFDCIIPVSAAHGTGVEHLLQTIVHNLKESGFSGQDVHKPEFNVVILGKPNVGKSSLMNILVEEERSIVMDKAGTTRESISEPVVFEQSTIKVTDTAGIRRKKAVKTEIENLMVKSSLASVRTADLVLLMVDAHVGEISDQELKLAFYVFEQGKALILLFNKLDIVDEYEKERLDHELEEYVFFMKKLESLSISCKTKKNIHKVLPLIKKIWERYNIEIPEDELTELIKTMLMRKPLFKQEKRLEVRSVKQVGKAPLTIQLSVNYPQFFGDREFSFFENLLRKNYDLKSVPIKFVLAKKK